MLCNGMATFGQWVYCMDLLVQLVDALALLRVSNINYTSSKWI